jgi:hypothetical protein
MQVHQRRPSRENQTIVFHSKFNFIIPEADGKQILKETNTNPWFDEGLQTFEVERILMSVMLLIPDFSLIIDMLHKFFWRISWVLRYFCGFGGRIERRKREGPSTRDLASLPENKLFLCDREPTTTYVKQVTDFKEKPSFCLSCIFCLHLILHHFSAG